MGRYRELREWNPSHFGGEVINRAQRCESESKPFYLARAREAILSGTKPWQRVFITEDAYLQVDNKADYHCSSQLSVTFKGYHEHAPEDGTPSSQFIRAVWPKERRTAKTLSVPDRKKLERAATATAKVDIGDRLMWAAKRSELAGELVDSAKGVPGSGAKWLLKKAIAAYREALRVYTIKAAPAQYAMTQNNLGIALGSQAELLAGEERAKRLIEAIAAYHEALRVRTFEATPSGYAMTQNNLGTTLRSQAKLLAGEERARRIIEAVAAYREALRIHTFEATPSDYAMTQNNLGIALGDQAELLVGEERARRIIEAIAAYREALRVYTPQHFPQQHSLVTKNLRMLASRAKTD
jgi:predicted RNA methylase